MTITVTVDPGGNVLDAVERAAIEQVLAEVGGNIEHAAQRLGIYRQSLQRKMSRHGLRSGAPQSPTAGEG